MLQFAKWIQIDSELRVLMMIDLEKCGNITYKKNFNVPSSELFGWVFFII